MHRIARAGVLGAGLSTSCPGILDTGQRQRVRCVPSKRGVHSGLDPGDGGKKEGSGEKGTVPPTPRLFLLALWPQKGAKVEGCNQGTDFP